MEKRKMWGYEEVPVHGARLVNLLLKEKLFPDFIKLWRQNFILTMKPPAFQSEHIQLAIGSSLASEWKPDGEYELFGLEPPN